MADPEVACEKTDVVNLSLKLQLSREKRGREIKFNIRRHFINKLYYERCWKKKHNHESQVVTKQKCVQATTSCCLGPGNLQRFLKRHWLKFTLKHNSRLKISSCPEFIFQQQQNVIIHELTVICPFQISSSTRLVTSRVFFLQTAQYPAIPSCSTTLPKQMG